MTYYRLAIQDRQTTRWSWKTTALTSLQAVLQLLKSYSAFPQDSIRVFTASSKEELSEMLGRQNNHLASGSVTIAQFLQERSLAGGGQKHSAADQAQTVQQGKDAVAWATWETHMAAQATQQGADVATWAKELWEKHQAAQAAQQATTVAAPSPLPDYLITASAVSNLSMSLTEKKRLEMELGAGGDHDTPYLFTLPISLKERLAWIRLQKQVRAGDLPS